MQAQQPTMSAQAYFNTKKASRDDSVGVAGTNTMIFDDYGKAGSRGIKSWQKARFENYDQRLKKQLYYEEQRNVRDSPIFSVQKPINDADIAKLPEERYGLVMIFRTFERAAFGLVMQSNLPVAIDDIVTTP